MVYIGSVFVARLPAMMVIDSLVGFNAVAFHNVFTKVVRLVAKYVVDATRAGLT